MLTCEDTLPEAARFCGTCGQPLPPLIEDESDKERVGLAVLPPVPGTEGSASSFSTATQSGAPGVASLKAAVQVGAANTPSMPAAAQGATPGIPSIPAGP